MQVSDVHEMPGTLLIITHKVRGIAELFHVANAELPLTEEGSKGISYVLLDIANELDEVRDQLDVVRRDITATAQPVNSKE